jgi:L-asparaginase
MRRDASAGGNVPTHDGEALVGLTGGLEQVSPYRIENWAMLPACHLGPEQLWALRGRVREIAESGEVEGIVITHGTDTIEETAYLLDRTLNPRVPVSITGAMRTSNDEGWDGPDNLLDASTVSADSSSRGRGVLVVFNKKVFSGRTAVKTHATDLDAFSAPYADPTGRVEQRRVVYAEAARNRGEGLQPKDLRARVAIVSMIVGDSGEILDLVRPRYDGVVVVAFGSGNVPPGAVPAIGRWIDEGKPVVLSTRCAYGIVTPLYAFDGGGARLVAMGAIPAGPRSSSQARMELTIALSSGAAYASQE